MALGATWQLVTDLLSIGFVTFIFAGLLSPWKHWAWAGWYGDQNTNLAPGTLVEPIPGEDYPLCNLPRRHRSDKIPVPTRG